MRDVTYRPQDEASFAQSLGEIALRTLGATAGTVTSLAHMAEGTAQVVLNSTLQVGHFLTFGYNHDHPVIQQALSDQQRLGEGIVSAILSPRETTTAVMEHIASRYHAAMQLADPFQQSAALGQLFNDVGQAALGLGYGTAGIVKPTAALGRLIGENAFTGPMPGSPAAQRGGVGFGEGVGNVAVNSAENLAKLEAQNVAMTKRLADDLRLQSANSPFTLVGKLTPEAISNARPAPGLDPGELSNPSILFGFGKYTTETFQSPSGNLGTAINLRACASKRVAEIGGNRGPAIGFRSKFPKLIAPCTCPSSAAG
ncbi:hypothetical protein [Ottowia testudinis]|uniref:Uncharacterized protein n=1 Tax=Ottowia testudinis TaxID=2816950 RepID=A0A975CK22_9BURK|nr:hypothetical protein [Ottowia testudinis]QTD45629.1 hypothetical protein J1M35_01510 [Ottowia testudinis]